LERHGKELKQSLVGSTLLFNARDEEFARLKNAILHGIAAFPLAAFGVCGYILWRWGVLPSLLGSIGLDGEPLEALEELL